MIVESATIAEVPGKALNAVTPVVGGGELLGMGISMLLVIVAILVLGWFYSRSRVVGGGAGNVINVVATRTLGPKERLLVVEVADQQLLLGMTSTAVQTLHVFDRPIQIDTPATSASGFAEGFADRLRGALQELRR